MVVRWEIFLFAASLSLIAQASATTRFENLRNIEPEVRVREFTSFKRIAEVADYQSWLHVRDGERVMFHDEGPGRVTRLWITGTNYDDSLINFYFDGEATPSLSLTARELFDSGLFPYPLAAGPSQSAGGRICYVPFPYEKSLTITDAGSRVISYYNITFEEYPFGEEIETWTATTTYDELANYLDLTGTDPKPTDGNAIRSGADAIDPGETLHLMNFESATGVVQAIEFDLSPAPPELLANCSISMKFDGETTVDAVPLGEFFGSAVGEVELTSFPIGMRTNGNWYCYFSMPYWESSEIWIQNDSAIAITNLDWSLSWNESPLERGEAGYFHARRRFATYSESASDLVLFDESDCAGKFAGLSLYMEGDGLGTGGMYYLEGDARVYIDGSEHPFLHGTGNEDWFNGAFYYNDYGDKGANQAAELFSMPFHGLPAKNHFDGADNWTQAYRFNIFDPINWTSSMLFTIEHGQYPSYESGYYSCVTYSYQLREPASFRQSAVAAANARDHFYATDGVAATNTAKFITPKAETDAEEITLAGFSNVTFSSFAVSVPPNNTGVILQSVSDFAAGTNSVVIRVDGTVAGRWSHVDFNYTNSAFGWGISEVVLPAALTAGKNRLDLDISYSAPATEYGFRLMPLAARPTPGAAYDEWITDFGELKCFTNANDNLDGDARDNLAEFALGGDPASATNQGFYFPPVVATNGFEYIFAKRKGDHGLVYSLERSSNLVSNEWSTLGSVGIGELNVDFEAVTNRVPIADRGFFRLRIAPSE